MKPDDQIKRYMERIQGKIVEIIYPMNTLKIIRQDQMLIFIEETDEENYHKNVSREITIKYNTLTTSIGYMEGNLKLQIVSPAKSIKEA
jgi:hypothetical protein